MKHEHGSINKMSLVAILKERRKYIFGSILTDKFRVHY